MIFNVCRLLIFLTICGIAVFNPAKGVDCRKFVYAPKCRGSWAKRWGFGNVNTEDDILLDSKSLQELLKNIYEEMGNVLSEDQEDDHVREPTDHHKEEKVISIGKYPRGQDSRLIKFLLGIKKGSSDLGNIPVHEYDNL